MLATWTRATRKSKMDDVRAHLDDTHFGWVGEHARLTPSSITGIHSPVDPNRVRSSDAGRPEEAPRDPGPPSIFTSVVRTPNGNDYGKELLRLHYQQHSHPASALPFER